MAVFLAPRQEGAVGRNRQAVNAASVLNLRHHFPSRHIPGADRFIKRGADQALGIWQKHDPSNLIPMAGKCLQAFARADIPQLDGPVSPRAGQQGTVRRKGQAAHRGRMAAQRRGHLAAGCLR